MNSPILESKQKSVDNSYGITSGLFLNHNIPKTTGITVGINVINSQSNLKTVSMTCNTENAIIRYTLDYTDPTEESTEYINKIEVEAPITIKARGYKEGWIDSDVEVESIIGYLPKPEMIIKTDSLGNTYAVLQNVDSYPEDALVYYSRTNNPFEGTDYMSILTIKNALIKGAIAILTIALPTLFVGVSCCDYYNSDIGDITGQVVTTPIITQSGNNITIVCSTPNSTIYYTTDGTAPTLTSNLYSEVFAISANCTIKAIAVADGYITSNIAGYSATYIQPICEPPTISQSGNTVTFTCAPAGATIHYSGCGISGTVVSGGSVPITTSGIMTAYATADGYIQSEIASYSAIFGYNIGDIITKDGIEAVCIYKASTKQDWGQYIFVDKNHDLCYYIDGNDYVNSTDYETPPGKFGYEWGFHDYYTEVTSKAIGDGLSNTNTLCNMYKKPHTPGWRVLWDMVEEFRESHSNDWFVPTYEEIIQVMNQKNLLENLSTRDYFNDYRTSTENDPADGGNGWTQAWSITLANNNYMYQEDKDNHAERTRLCFYI